MGFVYTLDSNVMLLLGRFIGCDTRGLVSCCEEERRHDKCAPWEVADSASNVTTQLDLPVSAGIVNVL